MHYASRLEVQAVPSQVLGTHAGMDALVCTKTCALALASIALQVAPSQVLRMGMHALMQDQILRVCLLLHPLFMGIRRVYQETCVLARQHVRTERKGRGTPVPNPRAASPEHVLRCSREQRKTAERRWLGTRDYLRGSWVRTP